MTTDCSLNYKFNTWKFKAQTWGEHVEYRNCFWHLEQFLNTTYSPHVLQKEELLKKIYLYYLGFFSSLQDTSKYSVPSISKEVLALSLLHPAPGASYVSAQHERIWHSYMRGESLIRRKKREGGPCVSKMSDEVFSNVMHDPVVGLMRAPCSLLHTGKFCLKNTLLLRQSRNLFKKTG